uniref:non-specific serine/threonine protein kinase n=1 Tax=Sinocyclocheilus grahami TaxID=75366 RepID=A0A672N8V0_SINGR
ADPGWEMETVGKFEFSRKDLIGHGAFAVVFKGRHREKHDWEVAVKCINKKNLAKSQTLLGKEIKILKELKHENIVALHDFQVGCITLQMFGWMGTLSEDTIRVFLQQIAGAMRVLQAKGIIHRDLKPQNILLSHPAGRKSHSNNTCIKIADFGFARYLQNNMMAATLCGSPMYMAPEVIMSQNYDAKADLWSIGTIVFQCLTGKAPFQASSPQDLRLFYEKNKTLSPNIPRETSSHLRHLLLGLLQRNHKDRMDFDEFFRHPFLEASSSMKKCELLHCHFKLCFYSVFTILNELIYQVRAKALASPTQDSPGYLLKDSGGGGGGSSSKNSSCDTDDFVMVPAHFPSKPARTLSCQLLYFLSFSSFKNVVTVLLKWDFWVFIIFFPSVFLGEPSEFSGSNYGNYGQSVPIPVPTQIHNYQRMEQNLQFPGQEETKARQQQQGLGTRLNSAPCLLEAAGGCRQKIRKQHSDPVVAPQGNMMPFRTLHSSPRLSELMQRNPLPTILGSPSRVRFHVCFRNSSLYTVLMLHTPVFPLTVPPGGGGFVVGSGSPARVVFTVGSPPSGGTPPQSSRSRKFSAGSSSSISPVGSLNSRYPQTGICMDGYEGPSSPRYGFTDPISAVTFEAPELPEETLMEQEHTETLRRLRFMLNFTRCMVEVAGARGGEDAQADLSSTSLLQQQSLVADQVSSLSREWSYAEQLVLYMKITELLSSSLQTAMEGIKQGKLYPSTTVKQVVRRLNDLYKSSVMSCRSLSAQLERFFSRKHKLMDHINSITAERLLFSHTVQMVQTAALDEMFHQGEASVQRYHKALLLMEGLSLLLTDQADILSVSKCKQCIERRLNALQSGLCV